MILFDHSRVSGDSGVFGDSVEYKGNSACLHPTTRKLQDQSFFFSFSSVMLRGSPLSQERKELPEIRWCKNDRIFEGFSDFPPRNLDFCISGFLYFFWISGRSLGKSYWSSADVKTTGFLGLFDFTKN